MKNLCRLPSILILLTYGTLLSMAGCTLDRSGSCGEGDIVCTVFKKEYSFTTDDNTYRFEGRCEIEDDGGGSTLGDPMFPFVVLGKYDRHTKEFKEVVKVTGADGTEWADYGVLPHRSLVEPVRSRRGEKLLGEPPGIRPAVVPERISSRILACAVFPECDHSHVVVAGSPLPCDAGGKSGDADSAAGAALPPPLI